jgi:hypothetical protein
VAVVADVDADGAVAPAGRTAQEDRAEPVHRQLAGQRHRADQVARSRAQTRKMAARLRAVDLDEAAEDVAVAVQRAQLVQVARLERERGLAPGPVVLDPAAADRMSSVKGLLPR